MALVLEVYGGVLAFSTIAFLAFAWASGRGQSWEANRLKGQRYPACASVLSEQSTPSHEADPREAEHYHRQGRFSRRFPNPRESGLRAADLR